MALETIPTSGLTLHVGAETEKDAAKIPGPAIFVKLSDDILQDVKKASAVQDGLQFLSGNIPKIRLGKRTIDLSVSPETFRHELYSALSDSSTDLKFAGLVGHCVDLRLPETKQSLGSDAALAALKSSLASYEQEKQASQVNISSAVIAEPKSRFESAKNQKKRRDLLGTPAASGPASTAGTPRRDLAVTSAAPSEHAIAVQAMRTPLLHLLAIGPLSRGDILSKTHIPSGDLDQLLQKIGKETDGKWQLTDRAYRDLTPWRFKYSSKDDRQTAIENAVRAFDRMRIGPNEPIWQTLLPLKDRDKGITLTKLTRIGGAGAGRAFTPVRAASPSSQAGSSADEGKSKGNALKKRLLAKDPLKQRAIEVGKEKKRKEREAARSDREAAKSASEAESGKTKRKKATVGTSKIKSSEFVHSEEESGEEGEVRDVGTAGGSREPKAAANADRLRTKANGVTKAPPKAINGPSRSTNAPADTVQPKAQPTALTPKAATPLLKPAPSPAARPTSSPAIKPTNSTATKPKPSPAAKPTKPNTTLGKNTPNGHNLSAPTPSSQHRHQFSPQKPTDGGNRPPVPSPLGAARPRVASDVSDRNAVGVQRARTPMGLGITNAGGVVGRKRAEMTTSASLAGERATKPLTNGSITNGTTPKAGLVTNGNGRNATQNPLKRKAVEAPMQVTSEEAPAAKHRKTTSASSQSQKSASSSSSSNDTAATTTSTSTIVATNGNIPATGTDPSEPNSNSTFIRAHISYRQGVDVAREFRNRWYPEYTRLYDAQEAAEARGETVPPDERSKLWRLHERLVEMKMEMKVASERRDESQG